MFAILGGVWFPIGSSGALHYVAQALPSYWLVTAGRIGVGGASWGTNGWTVVAVWTLVLVVLARDAYRRDTRRV